METKWIAMLLLASSSLFATGCAGSYRARYPPRVGPGYARYDPRISDRHHRGVYGRDSHLQNQRLHR